MGEKVDPGDLGAFRALRVSDQRIFLNALQKWSPEKFGLNIVMFWYLDRFFDFLK